MKPYGPNVYYKVIPFEQLYTAESQPAVKVSMDDMPVVCASTSCSYTYEQSTSLITDFRVDGQNIVITGKNLPSRETILSSRFTKQECAISRSTDSEIRCAVANPLVAGSWTP